MNKNDCPIGTKVELPGGGEGWRTRATTAVKSAADYAPFKAGRDAVVVTADGDFMVYPYKDLRPAAGFARSRAKRRALLVSGPLYCVRTVLPTGKTYCGGFDTDSQIRSYVGTTVFGLHRKGEKMVWVWKADGRQTPPVETVELDDMPLATTPPSRSQKFFLPQLGWRHEDWGYASCVTVIGVESGRLVNYAPWLLRTKDRPFCAGYTLNIKGRSWHNTVGVWVQTGQHPAEFALYYAVEQDEKRYWIGYL